MVLSIRRRGGLPTPRCGGRRRSRIARVSRPSPHTVTFSSIKSCASPRSRRGFPSGPGAWNGLPSAYQLDGRVVSDPAYRDRMREAFQSLPVVSLVCGREELFGTRGLYLNTRQRGDKWERACSAEMILPDGGTGFQIDCGLR